MLFGGVQEPEPPEGNIEDFVRRVQRKAAMKWELDSKGHTNAQVCIVDVPLLEDLEGKPLSNGVMCELIAITLDDGTATIRIAPKNRGKLRLTDGRTG